MNKVTYLGNLKHNDLFILDGVTYKVGHVISGTNHYVTCTNVNTHKVKRIYMDTLVTKVEDK